TWAARLRPFDYADAALMVPDRPVREAALIYGIFGGTPRFLATIRPGTTLRQHVTQVLLSPRGEVHLQLERIIEQEKGIREPAEYRAVLTAIAHGHTLLQEIATAAGLADRVHVVRRAITVLENIDLVRRERNFDAPAKAAYRYRIADNAVRFWFHFVAPNRSGLETGEAESVWSTRVAPHLDTYMGLVFERIVREAFDRHHTVWGLPLAMEWSRWEGHDRNRRSIELDVVARLEDGRILVGEVKWSARPVDVGVHSALLRNLEDLGRSGQGWAKDALDPARSGGYLYVSAAGFTQRFREAVAEDRTVRLMSLEDLYKPGGLR
ncbi:MAG: ATP-binding protein, partial [Gemmatimonadaceae bacterium]